MRNALLERIMEVISSIDDFFRDYPIIQGEADLCAHYRKVNKLFVPYYVTLTLAYIGGAIFSTMIYLCDSSLRETLPGLWTVCGGIILVLILHTYCAIRISERATLKNNKLNIKIQRAVHTQLQVFVSLSVLSFMMIPLSVPLMGNTSEIASFTLLVGFLIQVQTCVWVVDGLITRIVLLNVYNAGYCCLCMYMGYFKEHNIIKFISPTFIMSVFFLIFDRFSKQNFIFKRLLKQQKNMYERHLENVKDPVLILDSRQLLFANEAFHKQIGVTLEDFYAKASTMTSRLGESLEKHVRRMLSGNCQSLEKTQHEKYYENATSPTAKAHKKTFNVTLIESGSLQRQNVVSLTLHDATEELMLEEARVEEKYKNMLLFSLSHELRTPLNIFQAFLSAAKPLMKSIELVNLHRNAKGAWRYLRNKISDILDYAQILTGELALHRMKFSLSGFIRHLKKMTYCLLEDKQAFIHLEFTIDGDISDDMVEDRDRLEQVLFNLLSNAVNYTEKGTISLRVFPSLDAKERICFEVDDTGCGMSPQNVSALFELKTQYDSPGDAARRSTGLSGLGLTISKLICNRMGSDIRVKSVKNVGSTFSFSVAMPTREMAEEVMPCIFTIPAEEWKANSCRVMDISGGKQKERRLTGGSKGRVLVLVVDDNQLNRFVAKSLAQKFGAETDEAFNGKVAIEKLCLMQSHALNDTLVILMDVNMPVMDGIEATIEIRRMNRQPRPYIIALTALASESEREKCFRAGMDGFLSKPLTKQGLRDIFTNLNISH